MFTNCKYLKSSVRQKKHKGKVTYKDKKKYYSRKEQIIKGLNFDDVFILYTQTYVNENTII